MPLPTLWGLAEATVEVHNGGMNSATWFVGRDGQRWVAKAVVPAGRFLRRTAADLDVGEDDGMIGDRWGVTDGDVRRRYPCDDLVDSPELQAWRGVRVEAPAEAVWPWVAQVRIAPYAYDWIDNLGRRSPRHLVGLAEPVVGEAFTTAGGRKLGRIISVDPGRQLTAGIMGGFMSYVLVPEEHDTTRLLLKVVMRTGRLAALGLSIGDLIMARRQLLNLKHLAERTAA